MKLVHLVVALGFVTGCGPALEVADAGSPIRVGIDPSARGTGGGGQSVGAPIDAGVAVTVAVDGGPSSLGAVLSDAYAGPDVVAVQSTLLSQLLVFSVGAAWQQTGQLVTTGTVTWLSVDVATWQPSPADRLVVINPQQGRAEYTVRSIQSTTPERFFQGNWQLEFGVSVAERFVLDLSARSINGSFQSAATGTLHSPRGPVTVNLSSTGTTFFETDSTGSEYRNQYRLVGRLERGATRRDVDENWSFQMVTSRSNNKTSSATLAVRVDNGSLVHEGQNYRWNDCRTAKAFTDGKPSQASSWSARCNALTREGVPFGQYRVDVRQFGQAGGSIGFVADLADGTTIELERWAAY